MSGRAVAAVGAGGETTGERELASPRLLMVVVVLAIFVSVLTGSMVNVVIPIVRAEFGASVAQVGWIVTGFALAFAVGVPLAGRISDVYGVRRVFTVGLLGFAVGGLICALAPSLPVLILGRIVQAAGGAAVPALSSIAVVKALPPGSRGGALGLIASTVGIGSAVGPVVGGVAGQFLGWRALFLGSLALMLCLIPIAQRALPDGGTTDERDFDLAGGLLLGLGAGLFLFGITQGQVGGFTSVPAWGSFLGAAVSLAGFVWRIRTASRPFVTPRLFRNRRYVAAMIVGFCAMLAYLAVLVFVPLLLIEVNGLAPATAGLLLTPGAVAVALLSPLTGKLSDRVGVRLPIVAGLVLMTVAALFISTVAGASPWLIAAGILGVGAGFAFVQPPTSNAAASSLPPAEVGVGMGIFSGAFFLGSGTGPALIGAVLAAREQAGAAAINPLFRLDAAHFSDAFLATVPALLIALVAAMTLRRATAVNEPERASVSTPSAPPRVGPRKIADPRRDRSVR